MTDVVGLVLDIFKLRQRLSVSTCYGFFDQNQVPLHAKKSAFVKNRFLFGAFPVRKMPSQFTFTFHMKLQSCLNKVSILHSRLAQSFTTFN